jgi:hypothetical protein
LIVSRQDEFSRTCFEKDARRAIVCQVPADNQSGRVADGDIPLSASDFEIAVGESERI